MFEYLECPTAEQEVEHLAGQCTTLLRENERLRAVLDAAIRVLSDYRLSLQSRVNDARATLAK